MISQLVTDWERVGNHEGRYWHTNQAGVIRDTTAGDQLDMAWGSEEGDWCTP